MGYRGPKARLIRRFGEVFTHSPKYDRILQMRPNPAGQHGPTVRQARMSEYIWRLFEKQKLKAIYNISKVATCACDARSYALRRSTRNQLAATA